ncbi:MAG: ribosome-associated translation inhibitor RaiA [Actinomycetes bacterium]
MEIVVRGRHIEVSDRFRELVAQKLSKVERYDGKCHRVDVEVSQESNPRLADQALRVEITCHGKGPVIRAEAAADEKYAALDLAYSRLVERLRRAADRRHDHHRSQGRALAERMHAAAVTEAPAVNSVDNADDEVDQGPFIVREKTHRAPEMTLDQALYEMELVGHDFFLFQDASSGTPSVVYRRKGYDYGVLHLEVDATATASAGASAS